MRTGPFFVFSAFFAVPAFGLQHHLRGLEQQAQQQQEQNVTRGSNATNTTTAAQGIGTGMNATVPVNATEANSTEKHRTFLVT